jgi:hypothetical protein
MVWGFWQLLKIADFSDAKMGSETNPDAGSEVNRNDSKHSEPLESVQK